MTPLRNSFKYKDFKAVLEHFGCYFVRRWKGSHEHRFSPLTGMEFPIPRHWAKEFKEGTLFAILKQAGITKEMVLKHLNNN